VVLLEAMAASIPIVASDLPGYRNVTRPGVDAVLVRPGDAAALARALKGVLACGPEVSAMVASGECRAARFSMEHLAERYLELYARVAG
jgi:glycosyltransferase involved in cell wall biosynthesis